MDVYLKKDSKKIGFVFQNQTKNPVEIDNNSFIQFLFFPGIQHAD